MKAKDKTPTTTQADPKPQAKPEPKPQPGATAVANLTLTLVERVHKLYEELGRKDVRAVEEMEKAALVDQQDAPGKWGA